MKKRIMAVALVLAMTAGLTACGKTKVELCEYKGIALQSVGQDEIDKEINNYIETSFVEAREIEEEIKSGDTAYINFIGKKDGVAFEGGTDDSEEGFPLTIGSNRFIPGFEDGVIGMKKGETKVLELTFPEDYGNEELNGAAVTFDVTVKKATRQFNIEFNDENVKNILGYDSVQVFKDTVAENLNKESYISQIGDYLSENCSVSNVPEEEINEFCDIIYNNAMTNVMQYAQYYGVDATTMLQATLGFENEAALRDYCYEGAADYVKYQYIIKEIAKKENIEVSDDEFAKRGEDYAKRSGFTDLAQFIESEGEDKLRENILIDITFDYLLDNAKIF